MTPARRYHAVATQTASSERLLILLFHAALSSMEQARHLMDNDRPAATTMIDKALAIVQELQGTLDMARSPAITTQLADVYAFVIWRLIAARNRGASDAVAEAIRAFAPIVEAFDGAVTGSRASR